MHVSGKDRRAELCLLPIQDAMMHENVASYQKATFSDLAPMHISCPHDNLTSQSRSAASTTSSTHCMQCTATASMRIKCVEGNSIPLDMLSRISSRRRPRRLVSGGARWRLARLGAVRPSWCSNGLVRLDSHRRKFEGFFRLSRHFF